jgi:hypothetical protein
VLTRLGEARLDDDVVERHGGGQLGLGAVAAQLVGHAVQAREHLAMAPGELLEGGRERP